jgi:hypothetical protein
LDCGRRRIIQSARVAKATASDQRRQRQENDASHQKRSAIAVPRHPLCATLVDFVGRGHGYNENGEYRAEHHNRNGNKGSSHVTPAIFENVMNACSDGPLHKKS